MCSCHTERYSEVRTRNRSHANTYCLPRQRSQLWRLHIDNDQRKRCCRLQCRWGVFRNRRSLPTCWSFTLQRAHGKWHRDMPLACLAIPPLRWCLGGQPPSQDHDLPRHNRRWNDQSPLERIVKLSLADFPGRPGWPIFQCHAKACKP
jgi:hypothetical protein